MTAQETNVAIWESTLDGALSSGATTINVASTAGTPSIPFYVVIDPGSDAKREVVLVDDSKTATTLVVSGASSRGRDGTSDVSHDSGAVVGIYPVPSLWEDINDRVDGVAADVADKADTTYVDTGLAGKLALAGGTMTGAVVLDGYDESVVNLGNLGTNPEIDLSAGSVQVGTLNVDCTLTVANTPGSSIARPVTLILSQGSLTVNTISWPSGWTWFGEFEPSGWSVNTERTITLVPIGSTIRAYVSIEAA